MALKVENGTSIVFHTHSKASQREQERSTGLAAALGIDAADSSLRMERRNKHNEYMRKWYRFKEKTSINRKMITKKGALYFLPYCAYLSAAAKSIQTRIERNVGATSGTTEDEMFLIDSVVAFTARHDCCCRLNPLRVWSCCFRLGRLPKNDTV